MPVTGRFDIELDEWIDPRHRKAAVLNAWTKMVEAQQKMGSSWTGDTPRVEGPLQHVDFAEDASSDLGPDGQRPDPRDREACDRFEKAEKARAARKAGLIQHRVDFTLTATFRRRANRGAMRVHIPESR